MPATNDLFAGRFATIRGRWIRNRQEQDDPRTKIEGHGHAGASTLLVLSSERLIGQWCCCSARSRPKSPWGLVHLIKQSDAVLNSEDEESERKGRRKGKIVGK